MFRRSVIIVGVLCVSGAASQAVADIYQWAYVNPSDPSQGVYQSTTLCSGGAGASTGLGANLANRDLTKAYLIDANLLVASLSYSNLYNANLSGALLFGADLSYVRASYANFNGADIHSATLWRADLSNTDLSNASFVGDTMNYANLTNANLSHATLHSGVLSNANLTNANLSNADFSNGTLTGATFTGATVAGATFGQTIGFTAPQLYSTASYKAGNLNGIFLQQFNMTGWNFAGQNLSKANLWNSTLTNADLTNADLSGATFLNANLTNAAVRGADFGATTSKGFSATQLYSTATYKSHDLSGIVLASDDLTGWNFVGQNLSGASLHSATLTGTNLSGADLRNAGYSDLTGAVVHNTILTDGTINGLSLAAGETLLIRNNPTSPIHVTGTPSFDSAGLLQMIFDGNPWGSTISFDSGVSASLAGELDLTVSPGMDERSLVGDTFRLFDWTGVTPAGQFAIVTDPGYIWDTSQLYTSGQVTLLVPEPSTLVLLGMGAVAFAGYACRRRRKLYNLIPMVLAAMMLLAVGSAQADVFNMPADQASLQFVTVGDPGNVGEQSRLPEDLTYYGSVGYTYQIGKYDVTTAQYCQFLNAVAKTDTYGLYNRYMATDMPTYCHVDLGIAQSGIAGSYSYSVMGNGNVPIFDVSWGDAARFCNWLQNGQPTGPEGSDTTEAGAYTLNGAVTNAALMAITRNVGAAYFIPSENEWYKAAFYKVGGTNAGYWKYPTRSDTAPSNVLSTTGTNNANYYNDGYTDPTNYLTPVGYFAGSPGPYGAFDQAGDLFQWDETAVSGSTRGLRGGSYSLTTPASMSSYAQFDSYPANELGYIGFRVAMVPEPTSIMLLVAGGLCLLAYAWRRRK